MNVYSGFYQVKMGEKDQEKIAFILEQGTIWFM
jgi:hypothetical protein